jgi:hypothetical protein
VDDAVAVPQQLRKPRDVREVVLDNRRAVCGERSRPRRVANGRDDVGAAGDQRPDDRSTDESAPTGDDDPTTRGGFDRLRSREIRRLGRNRLEWSALGRRGFLSS